MALPTSGQITLQQIHDEAGGTTNSTAQCSVDDADIRALINRSAGGVQSFDDYYGAASSNILTCLRIGGGSTTTNQFPNCNASVAPSGSKLIVVVVLMRVQSGSSIPNGPSSVTVGGQSATLRTISNANVSSLSYGHINSIWTLDTNLSGTQFVTGSGMTTTGNNSCHVYQIQGHSTSTPVAVGVTTNYTGSASTSRSLSLSGANGGAAIFGVTASGFGGSSISVSPSSNTTVVNNTFSNLNHAGIHRFPTSSGSTSYTFTNNQSGYFNIVGATFK